MKKISAVYTSEHWGQLDFSTTEVWDKAVDVFNDRIRSRFIKPLDAILPREGAGFLVIAIHCLLIEMFEQFRRGVNDTPRKRGTTEEYFVSFLTQPEFGFTAAQASTFYDHFRCGLHHQGQTKEDSRIVMKGELVKFMPDGKSLQINRTRLHGALIKWLERYTRAIRDGSDSPLRENFKLKMNFICSGVGLGSPAHTARLNP